MKQLLPRLLVLSLSTILALLLIEMALRLAPTPGAVRSTRALVQHSSRFHKPDFRRHWDSLEKRAGTFRILVIGDSFTWGSGIYPEDSYSERLERRLRELATEPGFEVLTWSRPGWNTLQEWRTVRGYLPRLRPDLMVIGYCLNDAEPRGEELERLRQENFRRVPESAVSRFLYRTSRLYHTLFERWENLRQRRALRRYYRSLYDGQPGWSQAIHALRRFRSVARRRRIPLVLMIFPIFDSQLDDAYRYRDLHRKVAETAEELGLRVLDLLPVYSGIDGRRLALEPFTDAHPNEVAHRIAADALLDYLLEHRLVPVSRAAADPASEGAAGRRRPRRAAPRPVGTP